MCANLSVTAQLTRGLTPCPRKALQEYLLNNTPKDPSQALFLPADRPYWNPLFERACDFMRASTPEKWQEILWMFGISHEISNQPHYTPQQRAFLNALYPYKMNQYFSQNISHKSGKEFNNLLQKIFDVPQISDTKNIFRDQQAREYISENLSLAYIINNFIVFSIESNKTSHLHRNGI